MTLCSSPEIFFRKAIKEIMMKFERRWVGFGLLLAAVSMVGISGCGGGGPKLHQVSGTLTHNGKPLPDMVVQFTPVADTKGSIGTTDSDGKFTLKFSPKESGVTAGEHVVHVAYEPEDPDMLVAAQAGEFAKLPANVRDVLKKYSDPQTSPCKVVIDGDTSDLEVKLD